MDVFIDLAKVYDSVQHEVIIVALEIFGAPSTLIGWVMKLCTNFEVEVKVGKHKVSFDTNVVLNKVIVKHLSYSY